MDRLQYLAYRAERGEPTLLRVRSGDDASIFGPFWAYDAAAAHGRRIAYSHPNVIADVGTFLAYPGTIERIASVSRGTIFSLGQAVEYAVAIVLGIEAQNHTPIGACASLERKLIEALADVRLLSTEVR